MQCLAVQAIQKRMKQSTLKVVITMMGITTKKESIMRETAIRTNHQIETCTCETPGQVSNKHQLNEINLSQNLLLLCRFCD